MAEPWTNPYAPPDELRLGARASSGFAAQVLVAVLCAVAALRGFRGAVYLAVIFPSEVSADAAMALVPDTLGLSWIVTRPFFAVCVLSFCFWLYRANQEARRGGARHLSFTPGWAVASVFIPFVNLVGPYRAVREIHVAGGERSSIALPVWWGVWIGSLAWSVTPYHALGPASVFWGQAVFEILRASSAVALVVVVKGVERRLQAGTAAAHGTGAHAGRDTIPRGGVL